MNLTTFKKIVVILTINLLIFTNINIATASENEPDDLINYNEKIEQILFDFYVKITIGITQVPSLVACVIKDNETIWAKAYGYSNFYLRKKATLDTIYLVGSISKTITATAVMQLFEKGLFCLDDDVNDFLPFNIRNPKYPEIPITFRMLLAHQSSIADLNILSFSPLIDNKTQWLKDRVCPEGDKYSEKYWLDYPPGERYNYSNMGFVILSLIIERLSNKPLEEYCQENIFKPLDMNDTSFDINTLDKTRFAKPNFYFLPKLYIPFYNYDVKCLSPCCGLRTTALDLSHFLIAHMNEGKYMDTRILNQSTVELMHSVQYNIKTPFYSGESTIQHGLGWVHFNILGEEWEGNSGGSLGYTCHMFVHKEYNESVIFLTNGHFVRPRTPLGIIRAEMKLNTYMKLALKLIEEEPI